MFPFFIAACCRLNVSNTPLQDVAGLFLDARKRTLLALTLAVLEEVSSSADHAQLGQYS